MPALIEAQDIRHGFGGQPALALDHLHLEAGQAHLLLGPSGCGKTTLLHILAGLLMPDSGSLHIAGQDVRALGPAACDRFRGQHIGLIFQRLHLLGAVNVLQNLMLAQHFGRRPPNRSRALALLDQLGLAHRAHAMPDTLSQGEAQRVAIARALVNQPAILLADEPTSSLDDDNAQEVIALLRDASEREGAALLVVTHDQRLRAHFPDATLLARPEPTA